MCQFNLQGEKSLKVNILVSSIIMHWTLSSTLVKGDEEPEVNQLIPCPVNSQCDEV